MQLTFSLVITKRYNFTDKVVSFCDSPPSGAAPFSSIFPFSYPSLPITSSLFIPFSSIRFSAPGVSKGSASFPSIA